MKFLKWFGVILFFLISLFFIIPLFLPSTYTVKRSIIIEKPLEIVFQAATDMGIRSKWDPFIKMDPDAIINIQKNDNIVGSGYTWKGDIIGEGKLTILEFIADSLIKSKIEFISPHSMDSYLNWVFQEKDNEVKISWILNGSLSYPFERWGNLITNDNIAIRFEKGLHDFKRVTEKLPDLIGRTGNIEITNFDGLMGLTVKKHSSLNRIVGTMINSYSTLTSYFKENDIKTLGNPFTYYNKVDSTYSNIIFDFGFETEKKYRGTKDISFTQIPASKVVKASHFGHFKTVKLTHEAVLKYIEDNNLEQNGPNWDIYITNPLQEPNQSKWETHVYFPIK